jgi:hypothetical protein
MECSNSKVFQVPVIMKIRHAVFEPQGGANRA